MTADRNTVKEKLRTFITSDLIRDPEYPLADNEPLIDEGLIDSFALAEIGVYAETEFDVYIPDSDLTVDNMGTLNKMTDRIMQDIDN